MTMSDKQNLYSLPSDGDSPASNNGNGHERFAARRLEPNRSEQREVNLKLAAFYLVVAFALILADALGAHREACWFSFESIFDGRHHLSSPSRPVQQNSPGPCCVVSA